MDALHVYYAKLINAFDFVVHDYWEEMADPRSKDLFMMDDGPWKFIAFIGFYIMFVTRIGPKLMKDRKAYELRELMLAYNVIVVILNIYFFCQVVYYLNFGADLLNFEFPNRNDFSPVERHKVWLAYLYVCTKILDLMDTIFFVLRKKYSQITGLHLYHHSIVPIFGWLVIKIAPTSPCLWIFPLLNTIIHIIMYSYYALSALGPKVQRYLWWKKYLTQLQLGQFLIFAAYAIVFVNKQKGYPMGVWLYIGFPQPFLFFYLFWSFYKTSYRESNNNLMYTSDKVNGNHFDNNNDFKESPNSIPNTYSENNIHHRRNW